jgi:hypothetical protein
MMSRSSLVPVEFAEDEASESVYFIDSTSICDVVSSFVIYFGFVTLHFLLAIRCPGVISYHNEFFKLNKTKPDGSVDLDFSFSLLQPSHRSITMDCSIARGGRRLPTSHLTINLTSRVVISKNFTIVSSYDIPTSNPIVQFQDDARMSSPFHFFDLEITDFDTVTGSSFFTGDLSSIRGFLFHWSFFDFSAVKFSRAVRILTAFAIGYMTFQFIENLQLEVEVFTTVFCLIIGVAGVFAGNFHAVLSPTWAGIDIADACLLSVYLGFFRLFGLLQLELIRAQSSVPRWHISVAAFGFCLLYSVVDGIVAFGHLTSPASDCPYTQPLLLLDIIYLLFLFIWMALAALRCNEDQIRRFFLFSTLIIGDLFSNWIWRFMNPAFAKVSITAYTLKSLTQLPGCVLVLFLLQSDSDLQYRQTTQLFDFTETHAS